MIISRKLREKSKKMHEKSPRKSREKSQKMHVETSRKLGQTLTLLGPLLSCCRKWNGLGPQLYLECAPSKVLSFSKAG